jgi:glycosyltransferase involved in cell wall biosynthesis
VISTSFSIIITCYNQSALIRETVQSALCQTYAARQIIVVDDASTDASLGLLKQYGDAITVITRHDNGGASAARNLGASVAEGQYLVFLDGDDILLPWALQVYARLVGAKDPKVILGSLLYFKGPTIVGSLLYFRDRTPVVDYDAVPDRIAIIDYDYLMKKDRPYRWCASAMVIERHAFEAVSGWTEAIFPADDFDLMLKLGYSGRAIQIDFPPTVCYRVHTENTMRQVPRCALMLCRVIERARSGVYAGGDWERLGTYACLGGPVLFWLKKALSARCYAAAFNVFSAGLPMIVVAAVRRLNVAIAGRQPLEVLPGLSDGIEKGKIVAAGL